jgi:uncharacterized protein (TIGR00369 family)
MNVLECTSLLGMVKIMNHLEFLRKMAEGELPGPPVSQVLGFNIIEVEEGRVVMEMDASERLHNPMGTLHGGILCDIADAAMGFAFVSTLADDELFTTVEIKLNFLKPIFKSKLRAEGKLIKKGSRVGLLECHVYDEKQSLVAHSTSTCMILKGNSAGKRLKIE